MSQRLAFPAPHRCWKQVEGTRKYSSHPWEVSDVLDVLSYGGYFVQGGHDFDGKMAASLALGGKDKALEELMREEQE